MNAMQNKPENFHFYSGYIFFKINLEFSTNMHMTVHQVKPKIYKGRSQTETAIILCKLK